MINVKRDAEACPKLSYKNVKVKLVLEEQHYRKCCYCEKKNIDGQVEHFRPQSVYPELIDDYNNLLWACGGCNTFKADKLPVVEKLATTSKSVCDCEQIETYSIQNPALGNDKDWKIEFDPKTGEISSDNELVVKTIAMCKLNRKSVCEDRLKLFQDFEKQINRYKEFCDEMTLKPLIRSLVTEDLLVPIKEKKQEYIAVRKNILTRWLKELLRNK